MRIGRENDGLGSLDTAVDLGGNEAPFNIKGEINELLRQAKLGEGGSHVDG